MKDLALLMNGRSMQQMVIVDDSPFKFLTVLENGIPVTPYKAEDEERKDDKILSLLEKYLLEKIRFSNDVRKEISNSFLGMQKEPGSKEKKRRRNIDVVV